MFSTTLIEPTFSL